MKITTTLIATCALALAIILPLGAQTTAEKTPITETPRLEANTATLAAITTEKYPDADSVIVDSRVSTRYAADGTSFTRDETLIKVLTEKGLRDSRTQSFNYNVFYESTAIIVAQIISPDGTITPIDVATNSKEMTDRSSMSSNIYDPNDKVLVIAIPGLKVGDSVQVIVETTTKRARMKDTYCDWQNFESTIPILHATYELRGPKNKPLRAIALLDKVGDTVKHTTRDEGDETVHIWTVTNVPQAFPEPSMPPFYSCTQRLLASTAANWKEVSQWYSSLCEPHLALTPEIRAKVTELMAPAKVSAPALTDEEKITRIFRFVSQEIRYMGIIAEKDSPGYEPHDVGLTFSNRYGVCRDKAALLAAMLRAAGFDASPVLINAGPLIDPEVPKIYFNHAITAVRHANGTYQLMDSTDENTADLFPSYLANKSYLVARAEGDTLHTSPVAPPEKNMLNAATHLTVADDGSVSGHVAIDFAGINDNAFRGSFARAKPEDIRRWLESSVKSGIPGATLTTYELTPTNMMDTSTPLGLTFDFTAPNYFTVSHNKTILQTPWFGASFSIAGRILGDGTGLATRRFPLEIAYTCGLDETLTINLPERIGETLALPDTYNITTPALTVQKTFTRTPEKPQMIVGKLALRLRAPQVAAGAPYDQLKNALKDIEYYGRQSPIFAAKSATTLQADVRYLDYTTTVTLHDARTWTTRTHMSKKVLTYAGKKDSGELNFDYNPIWETVKVENAKITLKDGTTRTVSPAEMNIMDAAWVATAPRYPAAKTLVVSLPGVEEGATIDYDIVTETKDQPWFNFSRSYFGFNPMEKYSYTFDAPANLTLYTSNNFLTENTTDKTANGRRVIQINGTRAEAPREGQLPPDSYLAPTFQAASLTSPTDYAHLINAAVAPLTAPTDAIKKKATELTTAASTETERVKAIRDYVARSIRNAGPNFTNLPLSCLTPAEKTLTEAYGNTADRAILIAALLHAAGLQPELLLTTSSPQSKYYWTTADIFQPELFSNLVVRVSADGNICYLDHISIYAEPTVTGLDDCMAIPLSTGKIETIHVAPAYETRTETDCAIDIAQTGDAKVTFTITSFGKNHEDTKRTFMEMTPENRSRYHQQLVSWISQAAEPTSDMETSYNYPLKLTFSANAPRYAARSGDYLYFQLPAAHTTATPAGADTRLYPLFDSTASHTQIRWTITLPAGTEIQAAPENLTWEGPADYGRVTIETQTTRATNERTILEITETIRLEPAIIPAASYSSLLEINRLLSLPSQWRVLLKEIKK